MSIREQMKRISYVANVCRTENNNPEIQYLLNELDSSIEDIRAELFGIDEIDGKWLGNMSTKELGDAYYELKEESK